MLLVSERTSRLPACPSKFCPVVTKTAIFMIRSVVLGWRDSL